jgi:putative membrane protein
MSLTRLYILYGSMVAIVPFVCIRLVQSLDLHGMMSHHMLSHIVLMNLAAPVSAALIHSWDSKHATRCSGAAVLIGASGLQLALLIGWHSPPSMMLVLSTPALAPLMQISLYASALFFWIAVYRQIQENAWRALMALLVTGKLYCMLAVLLVFSPRALYTADAPHMAIDLADQQLAGTMMVVACPLSYILIATVLTVRWLNALSRGNSTATSIAVWTPRWN